MGMPAFRRWFAGALRILPRGFRDRFGEDLTDLASTLADEARSTRYASDLATGRFYPKKKIPQQHILPQPLDPLTILIGAADATDIRGVARRRPGAQRTGPAGSDAEEYEDDPTAPTRERGAGRGTDRDG